MKIAYDDRYTRFTTIAIEGLHRLRIIDENKLLLKNKDNKLKSR